MHKTNKGFTLIELVIVIVIVGILSIVGVREYRYQAEKARAIEAISTLRTIADANIHYYIEHGIWCKDINLLPITLEGEKVTYNGFNRIQNNIYIYSTMGLQESNIALAYRVPFSNQRYHINVYIPKNLHDKNLYKISATLDSFATKIDKQIVNEINKKGRL